MKKINVIEEKGITLLALVITIIVMLILVGVTITLVIQGGLFDSAKKAKYQTEISEIKDALETEKVLKVSENGGKVPIDYGITLNDLDISESLKEGYKDELIISNGILYYNPDNIEETRKNWIEEINIRPYVESTSQTLVAMFQNGELNIGDYVSYIPNTVTKGYDPDKGQGAGALTGYTTSTQEITQENLNWRVLGYDEGRNEILLISGAPTKQGLYFYGHVGYNDYENVLNDICNSLYSKEGIGTARSMTMEDIDKYLDGTNYDKTQLGGYGYSKEFTNIYHPDQWDGTWSGTLTSNVYYYTIDDYITDPIKQEILKGKPQYQTKGPYYNYLATRFTDIDSYAYWGFHMCLGRRGWSFLLFM